MSNQLIAGTVMLNGVNGEKKFLVKRDDDNFDFVTTTMNEDLTSLASILRELKSEVLMDVSSIDLVELTNISFNSKKMPLFVFEMEEEKAVRDLGDEYAWETPSTLRRVLDRFQISGVPIFE